MEDLVRLLGSGLAGELLSHQQLEAALAAIAGRLRAGSVFNLMVAVMAFRTHGAAGCLTIHIPRKDNDQVEVYWRSEALEKAG